MTARLVIADSTYVLQQGVESRWVDLAVLPGGADALLSSTRAVDEGSLEAAIEVAEDWLMPQVARFRGEAVEVSDATGRLKAGLEDVLSVQTSQWGVAEFEEVFLRLIDLATGRLPSPALQERRAFLADVLLVRELAHHGNVREIRLLALDDR